MLKVILEEIREIRKEVYEIKNLINHKHLEIKCFGNSQNLNIEHQIRKVLKLNNEE